MTIFDVISNILFVKKAQLSSIDDESEFSPYLVNRWISMYSPSMAILSNFINKYLGVFDNKKDLYSLFCAVFPKQPNKRITYFKKIKEQKEDNEKQETIKQLAKSKELSIREVKQYVELYKDIVKS